MIYTLPLCFVLTGLALYGILGGADFGAGFWQLTAGFSREPEELRHHAHESMAPVWEANHVWLIFVLTVTWTCYPKAFGSMASTLEVALLVAGVGIILRGAAYALRTGTSSAREERLLDTVLGISSVFTPFALGAAAGGIAAGRVPVGNAAGNLFSSWLNPTSIEIGVLAVATGAYLAAVFLCGDAVRRGHPELAERFRVRALGMGVVAGAIAAAGIIVLRFDARGLFDGLVSAKGLPALIVSAVAGTATLGLVFRRRYEPARYISAVAVAAIVAGWALAQSPRFLPGLTVRQAASPYSTQVAVIVATLAGGALLAPSLATLFRLTLGGQLTEAGHAAVDAPDAVAGLRPVRARLLVRSAGAFLIAGFGLVNVADAHWAHYVGAFCFLGFLVAGFLVALPVARDT